MAKISEQDNLLRMMMVSTAYYAMNMTVAAAEDRSRLWTATKTYGGAVTKATIGLNLLRGHKSKKVVDFNSSLCYNIYTT